MIHGNEQLRAQHPQIANAATYALYIFFGQDESKLGEFREAQKIRIICLIRSIRIKDLPTLIKPWIHDIASRFKESMGDII